MPVLFTMKQILHHLFEKNTLQDVQVDNLQQLAKEFPYYSAAQFLLAKKFQETNNEGFDHQFQKAALYFHNPLWLHYQLPTRPVKAAYVAHPVRDHEPVIEKQPDAAEFSTGHDMIEDMVLNQEAFTGTASDLVDRQAEAFTVKAAVAEPEIAADRQTVQREEPFTFQAYHTVDYFASQGIKLSLDAVSGDKLGKQLKSFTEWLKTMRRLPEAAVEEAMDKINDTEIVKHAAHSLEENEVVTEAMAEVLVKQGKTDKAADLYRKLSLINPQKSAYFAAQIEDLKHH